MHAPAPVHSVLDMFTQRTDIEYKLYRRCTLDKTCVVNIDKYLLLNCLQVETMIRNLKDAIWEKDAPHKVTSFL